ncbi:hypothetical protein Tco_0675111 [Tanacetum coccineum]
MAYDILLYQVKGSDEELQSDMDTSTRKFEVICAELEEPLKLDVPVNIVATKDLDVSHRGGTCDVMKISQINTKIPEYEVSAKAPQN